MKYLVDTHILLWSFTNPGALSEKVREIILNEDNVIFYSQFSLWEISIKFNLGKLVIKSLTPEQFYSELEDSFFECLLINNRDLISFYKLPIEHKDPFDRMLIWQCIQNKISFISSDSKLQSYEKYGLKFIN
jgi:PIN domain nuclease of toxin-antitoxin system